MKEVYLWSRDGDDEKMFKSILQNVPQFPLVLTTRYEFGFSETVTVFTGKIMNIEEFLRGVEEEALTAIDGKKVAIRVQRDEDLIIPFQEDLL